MDQAVDGKTGKVRTGAQAKDANDKANGKAKEVRDLQKMLADAAAREERLLQLLSKREGGGSAAGASGSPGGPSPEPAEDTESLAALQSQIDAYLKLQRNECNDERKAVLQQQIDAMVKEKEAKKAKRDAGKPLKHRCSELQARVDKETKAYEHAKRAREEHDKLTPALQKAEAEALARMEEAKASMAKLHKEEVGKQGEPNRVHFDFLREGVRASGLAFPPEMEQMLEQMQAWYTKGLKDKQEAEQAAAKTLPEDNAMDVEAADGLPPVYSTSEIAWHHRRPTRKEGQSDAEFDAALLEWAKAQPTGTVEPAGTDAKPPGSGRGRVAAKEGEESSRERSRSDKGGPRG